MLQPPVVCTHTNAHTCTLTHAHSQICTCMYVSVRTHEYMRISLYACIYTCHALPKHAVKVVVFTYVWKIQMTTKNDNSYQIVLYPDPKQETSWQTSRIKVRPKNGEESKSCERFPGRWVWRSMSGGGRPSSRHNQGICHE